MKYRIATIKDIDEIMELVGRIIKCDNTLWDEDYPVRDNFIETLEYDGQYVIEEDGKIIAICGIDPATDVFDDLPCWTKSNKPSVGCRLGFDPLYQGKHLVIPFLKYCLKDAYERLGYDSFRFFVGKVNENAIHVYERFGFKRVGEAYWYDTDWYCYECSLPIEE